ncbi:MFS general substrate transporter [Dothidotthia symphoricarpi CBS 119687]|uniref:MFS general substrate transporter n=1 Tax=Dothidotthia symphoricarpi CBS 119687 TaxID=1392245 RepID=A0A6A6AT26_9PLEO|nr:MFS general substrate transporter [Dothidotthia symphoricarpi CBS 119687]KAF2134820.1 MFS general substrate transporter [Dothidotthia symphoricarpi CBS 119687]
MRSPVDFEKSHVYDRCREKPLTYSCDDAEPAAPPPPYSAFSPNRRRFMLAVVTAAGFFGPLTGAIYLPSLKLFETVFRSSETVIDATVSVYMVVFAIAPLFGAAASDVGGRKLVYMVGLGCYLVANILLFVLPAHIALLYVLRILQGFGSCIVFSVGAGTVSDIVAPANRASALGWFLMGPQLGPILGPVIGGQFATLTRWRWIFGFLAATCIPVYLAIVFCMPETLRSLVGNGAPLAKQPWISIPSLRTKPQTDIQGPKVPRPSFRKFMHLLKYPPHLIVSFNGALQFSGLYALYISFPRNWGGNYYKWSTQQIGYAYVAPGLATFITSVVVGRLSDIMRKRALAKNPNKKMHPERRMAIQIPGFVVAATGKVIYGWFCQWQKHPAIGLTGASMAGMGVSVVFITSTSFQTECDPTQTASLVALGGFLRNVAAAIMAAATNRIIEKAGFGWTFTGLGVLDLLCIPGIILILARGEKMREALKKAQQQG